MHACMHACVCVCVCVCVCSSMCTEVMINLAVPFCLQIVQGSMNSTTKNCRCHGISGSCTFSSCHSELPTFSVLAGKIKEAFTDSCRVIPTGHTTNAWVPNCGRSVTDKDLIHTRENDWCKFDEEIGSVGVSGLECSPHPSAPNACSKLCGHCKRGSKEITVMEEKQCGCTFHFCCDIKCEVCPEKRTYFTCS